MSISGTRREQRRTSERGNDLRHAHLAGSRLGKRLELAIAGRYAVFARGVYREVPRQAGRELRIFRGGRRKVDDAVEYTRVAERREIDLGIDGFSLQRLPVAADGVVVFEHQPEAVHA